MDVRLSWSLAMTNIERMYMRIFRKLEVLKDIYDFDIYDYKKENAQWSFSYLISCHRDNGFEIRKKISQMMPVGDVKTIFIVRDSLIKNFEKENISKFE